MNCSIYFTLIFIFYISISFGQILNNSWNISKLRVSENIEISENAGSLELESKIGYFLFKNFEVALKLEILKGHSSSDKYTNYEFGIDIKKYFGSRKVLPFLNVEFSKLFSQYDKSTTSIGGGLLYFLHNECGLELKYSYSKFNQPARLELLKSLNSDLSISLINIINNSNKRKNTNSKIDKPVINKGTLEIGGEISRNKFVEKLLINNSTTESKVSQNIVQINPLIGYFISNRTSISMQSNFIFTKSENYSLQNFGFLIRGRYFFFMDKLPMFMTLYSGIDHSVIKEISGKKYLIDSYYFGGGMGCLLSTFGGLKLQPQIQYFKNTFGKNIQPFNQSLNFSIGVVQFIYRKRIISDQKM